MAAKRVRDRLKRIAKEHGVKVRFHKAPKFYGGYYYGDKKNICVVETSTHDWFVSAFFHELAHVFEHRDGIYARYYARRTPLWIRRKIALRAERHTDKRAQVICKKYFPKVRYKYGYRSKWAVEYLRGYFADSRFECRGKKYLTITLP